MPIPKHNESPPATPAADDGLYQLVAAEQQAASSTKCPFCAEMIDAGASVCPLCRTPLVHAGEVGIGGLRGRPASPLQVAIPYVPPGTDLPGQRRGRELSRVTSRRRIAVLALVAVAGAAILGAGLFVATRNNDLEKKLGRCDSKNGITVRVYYASLFSKDDVVFDFQEAVGSSIRRIDPVHLLLQFGHELDKTSFHRLVLARKGQERFFLPASDVGELANEYTHGNPVWSFNHLPERLKTMTGSSAFGRWEGGWLGVLKKQTEDLNKFIADWTEY